MHDATSDHRAPPETILFVEDEVLIRMDMAEFLRECGYRVHEAGNANEAIEALQSKMSVDLVVTDIHMPGEMDGFALARWIEDNRPGVAVILTSGIARPPDRPCGLPETIPLLAKPYTGRTLLDLIKQLLAPRPPAIDWPGGAAGAA
jgi:CheY-like chemotaxis protein